MKLIIKLSVFVLLIGVLFHISCQKELSCENCKSNKPPIANAGTDQIIVLPKDSVTLDGTASSDPDGTINSYKWANISGPVSSNIVTPDSSKTIIKTLVMGVYKFELTVKDNGGLTAKDTVQVIVNDPAVNQPPVANGGADQTITLPTDSVQMNGSLSFDPDGTITSYKWIKIAGPASSNIVNPDSAKTFVKTLVQGVYKFELTVKDNGGLSAKDTVQVMVDNPAVNQPPIACAGADQVITLPTNSANLNGSCSADPENNITGYGWTKISGPSSFNITNANAVQTQVTNLVQGTYKFELKVTDAGGLFSKDTMQVTVDTVTSTCPPFNRPIINAQLIPFGTLSEARRWMSIASAGNKIVFAGGQNLSGASSTVDIYNTTTQTWSTAQLSVARFGIAAIAAGNKIYFAGGITTTAFTTTSRIDIYDVISNTWSIAELSEPRQNIAIAVIGNKILFAGGDSYDPTHTSNTVTNKVDIYDIPSNTWSTATLSVARGSINATTVGNQVYFAGGWYPYNCLQSDRIDIYNKTTNTWSLSSLSEPKFAHGGIAVGNNIYWAGGSVFSCLWGHTIIISCKVEIRNVVTGTTTISHLFQPATNQALLKDGSIVFYSGSNQFDIYNTSSDVWSIGVMNQQFPEAAVISINNTIYIAGGGGVEYLIPLSNQVWKLDF